MGVCSAKRLCFLFFNLLFLAIGGGLVGFIAWTLATIPNASQFISGTWIFQLTVFALGTVVAIIGLLGCIGGLCQNLCVLKVYIGLMVTLMFLQVGLVIAIYVEHAEISTIIESSWEGLNTDTKYELQKELKCCGIQNYTEYSDNVKDLPDSCFKPYDVTNIIDKTMDNLYTANCLDSMVSWIDNNVAIWVSSLLAIAVIQLISAITSCVYMNRVQKKSKVKPNEAIEMETVNSTLDNDQNGEPVTTELDSKKGKEADASSLAEGSVVMGDLETDSLKEEVLLVGAVAMKKTAKDSTSLTEGSVAMGNLEPDGWESASLHENENKIEAIDSRSSKNSDTGSTKDDFSVNNPEPEQKEMLVAGALVAGVAIAESSDIDKDKISLAEGSVTMGDLEDDKAEVIVIPPSKTPNEGVEDKNQVSNNDLPGSVSHEGASPDDTDKNFDGTKQDKLTAAAVATEQSESTDRGGTKTQNTNKENPKHEPSGDNSKTAEEIKLVEGRSESKESLPTPLPPSLDADKQLLDHATVRPNDSS